MICENKGNDLSPLWVLCGNLVTLISPTNYYAHCLCSPSSRHSPNNGPSDSHVYSHLQQKSLPSPILQDNEEKLQVVREMQLPREDLGTD